MANSIFLVLLFLSFIFGQFARLQLGNGISLTLLDCTMFFFFSVNVFSLFRMDAAKRKDIMRLPLVKPLVLFYGLCCLSLLLNAPFLQLHEMVTSSLYFLRFMIYSCIVFFVPSFPIKQKQQLILTLVVSVLIAAGVGFVQFVYYPNLRNLFYLGWDDHLYRLFSVYLDPNFASVIFVCLFLFLLGTGVFFLKSDKRKAVLFGVFAFLSALAVFLTYSRTGMITLLVGSVVLLLFTGLRRLLLLLIGGFLLLLFLTADVKVEGLNPLRTASSAARIESMRIGFMIFEKNPIFGVGFNAYRYAQHRYGFRPDGAWETSHADAGTDNSFLFVLATTGLIGLGSYLYVWFVLLRASFLSMKQKKTHFPVIVFSTLVAVLASSFFLNTLFYPFLLVWILSFYAVREHKWL